MVRILYFDPKFRDSWYTQDFEKVILKYVKPHDTILFLCAGKFRLRSLVPVEVYYLDIDPSVISDVDNEHKFLFDAFDPKLPEKIGKCFDVVVTDPPYHTAYNKRPVFISNLRKLAKRTIIVKWNIIPRLGEDWEMKALYIYESKRWWSYISVITVFERVNVSNNDNKQVLTLKDL